MRTFRPAARRSIVSILGLVLPDMISAIVDFGSPVLMDNWRTEIFFLYMILSNSIFMYSILNPEQIICTGKYCKLFNQNKNRLSAPTPRRSTRSQCLNTISPERYNRICLIRKYCIIFGHPFQGTKFCWVLFLYSKIERMILWHLFNVQNANYKSVTKQSPVLTVVIL